MQVQPLQPSAFRAPHLCDNPQGPLHSASMYTKLPHRRPSPSQPRVHNAPWMPVCTVLAVSPYNFAYAQLLLHVRKHVHPSLYATLQQVQAQRAALGLRGTPSAHLALLYFQQEQLAGSRLIELSGRCSNCNTVKTARVCC